MTMQGPGRFRATVLYACCAVLVGRRELLLGKQAFVQPCSTIKCVIIHSEMSYTQAAAMMHQQPFRPY